MDKFEAFAVQEMIERLKAVSEELDATSTEFNRLFKDAYDDIAQLLYGSNSDLKRVISEFEIETPIHLG